MYKGSDSLSIINLLFFITIMFILIAIFSSQVYANNSEIISEPITIIDIKGVEINTELGKKPEMPSTVMVEYSNGEKEEMEVDWDEIDPIEYNSVGEFTVSGTIKPLNYPSPLIEKRADPYIYKHIDGYYYFTASVPEYDRIILRRAKTIEGLISAPEIVIWEKYNSGAMSKHIWAPEIHYIDGKWYIYFAAGERDDIWAIRPYILECKDANPLVGNWEEKGKLNTNFESFSLDATTFEHKGERYIIWAQKTNNDRVSNLYIDRLINPWTIEGNQVVIAEPVYEWEKIGFYVNEGPAVIKRNGYIFVAYSASATDANYCMGMLTADAESDLLDPGSWDKTPYPVFKSNNKNQQYGPGHNSFTIAEDGRTDLLVYHARPYKEIEGDPLYDPNRHARVQRLYWNKDGTPNFTYPGHKLVISIKPVVKVLVK